ncbi:MAG TPA: ParB/RepB/Spo0J family partition protein [Polyangia bacterium]|nr:ParB/RepB/Spo0J family partition protein [Polyangia bacterium]
MSAPKRRALGRGLAALIPGAPAPVSSLAVGPAIARASGSAGDGTRTIAIEDVHPSMAQPRKTFDGERLEELAASIRTQGIIQPLIVRVRPAGGYELIAGERRWRAAQRAGLHEVPAVIRDVAPAQAFEMALVENLQREDLNPIEEAAGYERLVAEFGYTQEKLADRVGKERSTVANALRLLRLPDGVRALVADGRLSMGHARALLGLESPAAMEKLARRTVAQDLSVRKVEDLVRRDRPDGGGAAARPGSAKMRPSPNARDLGMRLARALGTRVDVNEAGPGRGHVAIHYQSLDQLDALIERIVSPR